MSLRICIYEDEKYRQFYPLTHLRPVYALRAGILPLFRRVERFFQEASISLVARDQVSPFLAEQFDDYPVNIIKKGEEDLLFLNGRVRDYGDLPHLVAEARLSTMFRSGGVTVAVLFQNYMLKAVPSVATGSEFQRLYDAESAHIASVETTASLYNYCWEIMADIGTEIEADFEHLERTAGEAHDGALIVNPERVHLEPGVEVSPGAVIDASKGPVYIGANCRIEAHATVFGPCYIGRDSVVLPGRVSASSIGHTCRVGGEVEESVFHAFVNKYHAGFIGHSYVGPWVNFGAMTTNSDLKNNYSSIRVAVDGGMVDSGSIKVGSFIGDHTKFGIGTLLNTGINIGVCCNIFGGSLITDREIPPFSWGSSDGYERYQFDKAVETAQRTASRRRRILSEKETDLLRVVFDGTAVDQGIMKL